MVSKLSKSVNSTAVEFGCDATRLYASSCDGMISPTFPIYRPLEIPDCLIDVLNGIVLTTYARDVFECVTYVESEIPILDDLYGFVLTTLGIMVRMVDHVGWFGFRFGCIGSTV